MVAHLAADQHLGDHVGAVLDLGDPEPHLAVVDEQRVADVDVAGETLVGRPADLGVAVDLAGGDRPPLPALELDGAVGEGLQPDLGALEVGQDAHAVTRRVRGLADQPVGLGVVLLRAVAHVEPGHVHPRVDQLADPPLARGGGSQGAHDLGSSHGNPSEI